MKAAEIQSTIHLQELYLKYRYIYFQSKNIQSSIGCRMGKKGKRSKKAETNEIVIDNILNRLREYDDRAMKRFSKSLYSDALSIMKEAVQFVEAKEAIIVKAERERHLFYEYLILQAYVTLIGMAHNDHCNYEEVIQIYNSFTSKFNRATVFKIVSSRSNLKDFITLITIYHELALIRVSNHVSADSIILFEGATNYMKKTDRDKASSCKEQIVKCLRATKNFGAAIDMDRKFTSVRNLDKYEKLESVASLAITYIERYRVEFHKHTKKENKQIFDRLNKFMLRATRKCDWDALSCYTELQLSYGIAHAQWYFLLSKALKKKNEDETWVGLRTKAIDCVQMLIADKWHMKDSCFYCHQAPTKDEVKLVCGECRVACYCSIDHQRVSWKKNAVDDMCFGHEAICPAMKAYRRWQESVDSGDTEKETKTKRRFGRECLGFLAYGLGLEDKCWF
ncbi:predicted protein [Chaetoceros tenuissimus]|uniref:MYND-type domain-containing protein n=1 Tax=Chaetoceros tenuissimus TaxID=426638 RepID=A0AAD3H8G0_9STRA|nr:predicted protein [Chaetoceros tenuissimus]